MFLVPPVVQPSTFFATLDQAAHDRDIATVRRTYGPDVLQLKRDPMSVLRGNGAYGTGKFGWHVLPLTPPGEHTQYAVFSTPLTMEDIGERLFEVKDDRLVRYVNEQESGNWKISHHNFHIAFTIPKKITTIEDSITLKHEGKAKDEAFLRFSPTYRVSKVVDDDAKKSIPFEQAGGVVALGQLVGPTRHLTIKYSGVLNLPNYGGIIAPRYAMLTDEYWYPIIARQPASYEATVEVPFGWSVVAQGEKTGRAVTKTGEVWSYRMDLPVSFFSLSAGAYHTFEQSIGNRYFRTWSFRMTPEQSRWQAVLYSDILKTYEKFAKFPFTGYGAVDQPNYGDGMLEAYSFNTGQAGIYPTEEPHEPSHTWFGGMIGNGYLKSFWNESFADFCEGWYRRNVPIGNPDERKMAFIRTPSISTAFSTAPLDDAPADIGPDASTIGYGKGSYVLQMLEDEIGPEKMVSAMRRWLAATPPGNLGEWADFEKVVGPDYKWFFDEWVRRPGFPVFDVKDVRYENGSVHGRFVFQGPAYRIHMQVLLGFPDGSKKLETVDTTKFPVADGYSFEIPCAKKPEFVSLDPWLRVIRAISNDEAPFNAGSLQGMTVLRDASHPGYWPSLKGKDIGKGLVSVDNSILVGNPETMPAIRDLCKQAGFDVKGEILTYKGTSVDLRRAGAIAVFPLSAGHHVAIALGTSHLPPETGNAQLVVFDEYGRFLRGETAPKTSGNLTFRL